MPMRMVLWVATALSLAGAEAYGQGRSTCPSLLNRTAARLQDDSPQDLCRYSGQVLLIVNTASFCGYTPQYESLEKLHQRFSKRGFSVLGFPSNDFKQEAADRKGIEAVCFNTYGVRFPMFAPAAVTGPSAQPLFADLTKAAGRAPGWNFHKYLVSRKGDVIADFASDVDPLDRRLTTAVEQALAAAR